MGLLSSVKKSLGVVKNKAASALSGIKKTAAVTKIAGGVAKLARSPVGKVAGFAAKKAGWIGAGITVAGMVGSAVSKKKAKNKAITTTAIQGAQIAKKTSTLGKVGKVLGTAALVGTGLYVGEQIAEKLGVRGGAGFIGKRPRKKRRGSRYAYIRVRRNRRGQGRLTKSEESRLRSLARTYENSEGTSRTRHKRKSRGRYPYWLKKYMFKKGKRRRR